MTDSPIRTQTQASTLFSLATARSILEELRGKYNAPAYLSSDPVEFTHRYSNKRDQEIVALLCALFAYGNVTAIRSFLERLFDFLGPEPAKTLLHHGPPAVPPSLYYRFQKSTDINTLLLVLHDLMRENHKGIEKTGAGAGADADADADANSPLHFEHFFQCEDGRSLYDGVLQFEQKLRSLVETRGLSVTNGWKHLVGDGLLRNSAKKRTMLFLRWMVRQDYPDSGLYTHISPAQLIVPLDVHMTRMGRLLGFTNRKSADRKTALEITGAFQRISPEDPLRYDFSLTRPGITGQCRLLSLEVCNACALRLYCRLSE